MSEVQPTITFIGKFQNSEVKVQANWVGDNRTFSRKVGRFSIPQRNGEITQDFGINSIQYPLSFFFDGENHRDDAEDFWQYLIAIPKWIVVHPTKGRLSLHLLTLREEIQPIKSESITFFSSTWITTNNFPKDSYTPALVSINAPALSELANTPGGASAASHTAQTLASGIKGIDALIRSLVKKSQIAYDNYIQVFNSFNQSVRQTPLPLLSVGQQVLTIIQTPLQSIQDARTTVTTLRKAGNDLIGQIGSAIDSYASLSSLEFLITGTVSTIFQAATLGTYETATEAIEMIETLGTIFGDSVSALEDAQVEYEDELIQNKYYSQTQTYGVLYNNLSLAIQSLLNVSLSLKRERRIVLVRDRTPVDLTVEYYGSLGSGDENLDYFISTNKLYGNDLICIPQGREVVIYG